MKKSELSLINAHTHTQINIFSKFQTEVEWRRFVSRFGRYFDSEMIRDERVLKCLRVLLSRPGARMLGQSQTADLVSMEKFGHVSVGCHGNGVVY